MSRSVLSLSRAVLAICLLAGFGTCEKTPKWKQHTFTKHENLTGAEDVELPASLWKNIEGLMSGDSKSPHPPEAKAGAESTTFFKNLPTEFTPLKIYLIEKNRGILRKPNYELSFAPGGGEFDLSDFVQPLNGSFYLAAEFMPGVEAVARKVYYVSQAVVRQFGDEKWGAGCNTYFDVTTAFEKAMAKEGFLLNTHQGRHVTALAGTFFFAAVHDGKLHLASLTIRDSKHRSLQCRRPIRS